VKYFTAFFYLTKPIHFEKKKIIDEQLLLFSFVISAQIKEPIMGYRTLLFF
jgi:hypothetical protein